MIFARLLPWLPVAALAALACDRYLDGHVARGHLYGVLAVILAGALVSWPPPKKP